MALLREGVAKLGLYGCCERSVDWPSRPQSLEQGARVGPKTTRPLGRLESLAVPCQQPSSRCLRSATNTPPLFSGSVACTTQTATSISARVRSIVGMPRWTLSDGRISSDDRSSSKRVHATGYRFEMCWIHARPDSAEMVNLKTKWNRTDAGRVRENVGEDLRLLLPCRVPEHAVSAALRPSEPEPAGSEVGMLNGDGTILIDLAPKTLDRWDSNAKHYGIVIDGGGN